MKNLLVYTNPEKKFSGENETLVKVQIDAALELGWERKDILLITNFPYEYNGVRAFIVSDDLDCPWDRTSNKIFVIEDLLNKALLGDSLYWYHDFDAYPNAPITEEELGLEGKKIGLTGYGYKDQINGGSFFFRPSAKEIFNLWCKKTLETIRTRADEKTMTDLTRAKRIRGYKVLNITYNFGQRCPRFCYKYATKPLKVLHFHPHYQFYRHEGHDNLEIFMYGKNPQGIPMMSEALIKVFQKHGVK